MSEGLDGPRSRYPDNQDALVAAVAAANPHTIVVLETGGPVTMPWVDNVQGIVEAWYPGIGGAQALGDSLFGDVNFSAKLPVSFARRDADLSDPDIIGMNVHPVARQISVTRDGQTLTRTVNEFRRSTQTTTGPAPPWATSGLKHGTFSRCLRSGSGFPTRPSSTPA